ncbi:hypothetical protein DBR32_06940 [Taibaiella sp. KBW10]|uniref:ligand-binding sensor domain-containing protein n=1 Tax=Taibaiella sp. KBW10 TaxID=2153357 RepID=UPI000F5A9D15|nr:HAMP domain-containing sensor histidine kinase [Taibaiella sp. KBW10]RQO31677.1 hypothetical protein DBR32_06940 [Taibaiella sp. KBW10]
MIIVSACRRLLLRGLLVFSLFFCPSGTLNAGTGTGDFSIQHFNTENGLAQNSVKDIVVDELGFLWLATEAGLVRYDGRKFSLFNKYNTGMTSSRMISFDRSPYNNKLQAITEDFTFLEIFRARLGDLYGNVEKLFPSLRNSSEDYSPLPLSWIHANAKDIFGLKELKISIDGENAIFIDNNKKLSTWYKDHVAVKKYGMPPIEDVRYLFSIDHHVYIPICGSHSLEVMCYSATEAGRVKVTGDIAREKQYENMVFIANIAMKQVFIRSGAHLYQVFRLANGDLDTKLIFSQFDFQKNQIAAVYYDEAKERIFLGSTYNGLYILSRKHFDTKVSNGTTTVSGNVYYHHIPLNDSSVLTGKGIVFSSGTNAYYTPALLNQTENMSEFGTVLFRGEDHNIWQGGAGFLNCYNATLTKQLGTWKFKSRITAIAQISPEALWVATREGNVYTLNPKEKQHPVMLELTLSSYVYAILRQGDNVWIGTQNDLYCYHTDSKQLEIVPRFHKKVTRNIYAAEQGGLWVCTYEDGLLLYRDKEVITFPKDQKKILNSVHAIVADRNGFFWLSTNGGIFQVWKQDLYDYADGKLKNVFYLKYEQGEGFNSNEFNGGGREMAVQLRNGFSTFASINGIVFFKPEAIKPELPDAAMILDCITLDNETIAVKDTVEIARQFANMSIHLTTPYFGNADNLVIEYKIDSSSWLPVDNDIITFNQLSAGIHTLETRKRSGFGNTFTYGTRLVIHVPPAYYETFLFKLAVLVCALSILGILFYMRLTYHKRKNKQLEQAVMERTADLKQTIEALQSSEIKINKQLQFQEQLSKNIAHDIRTPLKYLVIAAQYLSEKVRKSEMPEAEDTTGLYLSAERIYNYTDSLTNYLKAKSMAGQDAKPVHIHSLIEQKKETFELAAKEKQVQISNKVCPNYDLDTYPELFEILIHNLIDNAIKNTRQGTIEIRNEDIDGHAVLIIEDSGRGLSEEQIAHYNTFFSDQSNDNINNRYVGFGFLFMKDVQSMLHLQIVLRSVRPQGLRVDIYLHQ